MESVNEQFEAPLKKGQEKVDERLIMLCDGIFAIAITILVLDIKLDLKDGIDAALNDLLPKIVFYLITFFVIAGYWGEHRRLMKVVKRMDTRFLQITFLFLAFVTFFPVAFNMETENGHYVQVSILYTLVLAGCGFSAQLLWLYASWKHRLIDPDLDLKTIQYRTIIGLSRPVFFCLSLLLIPFVGAGQIRLAALHFTSSTTTMFYSWLLLPVVNILLRQIIYRHKRENPTPTEQHE